MGVGEDGRRAPSLQAPGDRCPVSGSLWAPVQGPHSQGGAVFEMFTFLATGSRILQASDPFPMSATGSVRVTSSGCGLPAPGVWSVWHPAAVLGAQRV